MRMLLLVGLVLGCLVSTMPASASVASEAIFFPVLDTTKAIADGVYELLVNSTDVTYGQVKTPKESEQWQHSALFVGEWLKVKRFSLGPHIGLYGEGTRKCSGTVGVSTSYRVVKNTKLQLSVTRIHPQEANNTLNLGPLGDHGFTWGLSISLPT